MRAPDFEKGVSPKMPSYDYRCTTCSERFEITRAMSSSAEECCPTCGGPAKRLFTPVGVAFKGTGFHNTDYKQRPKEDSPPSYPAKNDSGGCAGCPAAD
jgi:putative FmdB family regulatory protein